MPFGVTKGRKMRSKIRWFTEFCNSHYISQFAAFFIDARTKRSIVESCTLSKRLTIMYHVCIQNIGTESMPTQRAQVDLNRRGGSARYTIQRWTVSNIPPIAFDNDPSAGSPTETLLRLLLPLNDQVWSASRRWSAVAGSPKAIRRPH